MESIISLEIFQQVTEKELESLRRENLNLKIVIAQLEQDKAQLEKALTMAREIAQSSGREKTTLAELKSQSNKGTI